MKSTRLPAVLRCFTASLQLAYLNSLGMEPGDEAIIGIQRSGYLKIECVYTYQLLLYIYILITAEMTKLTFSKMSISSYQYQQNYHCHKTKERDEQTSDHQTITCLLPFCITCICKWFNLYIAIVTATIITDQQYIHQSYILDRKVYPTYLRYVTPLIC